ncbi:F-box and WD-40 domain protein CDC4 [Geosmithia morbida]|uniref:F-box and WD-40 domain protein CDC4 n=1 Tax=Geosmithia morbida TaxID=1094350 RepID=A0A9P4YW17_9HYPO|nr:F-box and WD-40 domain protein CDC4 [Geosmithia morbida]KAF4122069.1 F-box and WD-40 domain protein CDC4 [Geosmithia morbida]
MTHTPDSPSGGSRPSTNPSRMVSVNISEPAQDSGSRRFQLQMSECVETRTVTTTTRLTRKFPQVFDANPTPLASLDEKEFPLAMKPTPPELLAFSYSIAAREETDAEKKSPQPKVEQLPAAPDTPLAVKVEQHESPSFGRLSRRPSRSPSTAYPRHSRQTRSAVASASAPTSAESLFWTRDRGTHTKSPTEKLRRSIANDPANTADGGSSRRESLRQQRNTPGVPTTPSTSETIDCTTGQAPASRPRALQLAASRDTADQRPTGQPDAAVPNGATSPVESDSQIIFGSNVATPPITDTDAEPFADGGESTRPSARSLLQTSRGSVDASAGQDVSLPSPRLSPTLAAARLHDADPEGGRDSGPSNFDANTSSLAAWADETQGSEGDSLALALAGTHNGESRSLVRGDNGNFSFVEPSMFLDAFDSMKTEMKSYMMYQLLRRCARPTLRVVANAVNPTLKCDFFSHLPLELSYHILSYLNHRDLCRAAQVSKHWRNIVNCNETGWKELFDRDGFVLPPGELSKAISQGWGWQDPEGANGFERDLSMHNRLTLSEYELTRSLKLKHSTSPTSKPRTSKRKRSLNPYLTSERSKRRVSTHGSLVPQDDREQIDLRQHKSAGPISAACSAAAVVPDPHIGLPTLRQLHLFKSLYRRHYMMQQSWTSGKVKPSHVAFAAHPNHVITCLQFDEDKIITGSDDTFIHVYDTKTGKLRKKLVGHEGGVWALQYEGNILVSGSTDRSVRVWDIEAGICQQVFYGHTSTVRCLQILSPTQTGTTPDGQAIMQPEKPLIITGSRDSQLRVWRLPEVGSKRYIQNSLPTQESECPYFIRALSGHTHSVRAISAYGDTLVSGSYDSVVRVWRISTGECLHVLHGHSQKVYSVVLDHERNRCISGSMDSLVKIWDLATGACLHTLEGHSLLVGLLDLNDGRLVSAAADSTLRIWDPETGRCKNTLMAHTGAITCFQHDGQKVISGSEKTVKMWDIQTGECVQDLLTDLTGVWQVKFDGRRCVAAVQRDQMTYVEILDFGAVRDGKPPEELGRRILLNEDEAQAMLEEDQ